METPTTAASAKDKGNADFAAQKWQDAVDSYTTAIELSHPDKHVCYGNRSAANLKLDNTTSAVADANCAIDAKSTWWKAYSRLGAALQKRGEWEAACDAYKNGLEKVTDSAGRSKLTQGLNDCQARRPGGSGSGTSTSKQSMWIKIQSYLRYFIVMNAVLHCIPFVNIGGTYKSCLMACIVKYGISLSYHGKPSRTAEYGIKVIKDLSMHYLFLTFVMLMMGRPSVLVFFPLVTPDVYLLAGEMSKETPAIARTLSKPMKWIAKMMYGTDDYTLLGRQILAFNCMAEIGLGVQLIFEIFTSQRNVIGTVIFWQFLRTRHMLMDDMKDAFRRINGSITGKIGTIPVLGSVWRLIVKGASWMSKEPEMAAEGAKSSFPSCNVM